MKYEEFLELCKNISKEFSGDGELQMYYHANNWGYLVTVKKIEEPRLYVDWETGGYSGGSCWGDTAESYTSNQPEKDLQILDAILEKIEPSISFLQYKNLCNTLVKRDSHTDSQYYGNSTDYDTKEISIKSLYEYLVEKGFIEN